MMRRREKLSIVVVLIALAAALLLIGAGMFFRGGLPDVWHALAAPREDGSWRAVTFDGEPVGNADYLITVRWGKIVGGYDDCNGWAYQDAKPDAKGERMILSTLVLCTQDEKRRRIYRLLIYAPRMELASERELRLSRAGHVGVFRRCAPDESSRRCVPE